MTSISQNQDGLIRFTVDKSIYDDSVIEKVLYWWTADFVITRENKPDSSLQVVTLQLKDGHNCLAFQNIVEKISNDFIDYKNRQTIAQETSNIRDLLFAKAFANSDDFVEFTFQD